MAPCGPVVSVAGELWEVWETQTEDEVALEALETRYRSLNVTLLQPGEVQRGRLEPLHTRLFVTRTPLTTDAVQVGLTRQPGRARGALTACKIDRNLQVGTLTSARFDKRSSLDLQRTLPGVNRHLLSVYLVNLSSAHGFDFSLLVRSVAAQF